jgi:beta-lactamase superfamily II metal-dependent hydrolase
MSAEAAIVSVGANSFGHPDAAVIARWDANGTVFQTQSPVNNALIDGDITVTTNGVSSFSVVGENSGVVFTSPLDA